MLPKSSSGCRAVFPPGIFTIKTWEQKQGPLLAAVEIETGILNVLLFLIIAVAGFGILAIFFMIVVEKTRDIGILKALGASSSGVMSIFLSYGLALGVVGSGVGVALGLFFVRYINEIESAIAAITGRKVFDDKVYYFPEIPTLVEPLDGGVGHDRSHRDRRTGQRLPRAACLPAAARGIAALRVVFTFFGP